MTIRIPPTLTAAAPKILVAMSLMAGLLSLCFSWLFWARFHVDIPVEDSLTLLPIVQSFVETGWSGVSFQEWIAPHSSAHRIVVGRLLMAIEYKYLWGENYLSYLGSWLSIAALCYLYFTTSRISKPRHTDIGYFMLGIALVYTCSYTQVGNLISAVNALWYISAACCAFSIYLFVTPRANLTLPRAAAACLLAIIASYSTFLGIIGCLVLALLAIQSRSRHAWWISVLMLGFVALYMKGIKTVALSALPDESSLDSLFRSILVFIEFRKLFFDFTVAFLSSPMSKSSTVLSYIYVILSWLLVLYGWTVLVRQWYSREFHSQAQIKFYLAMATIFLGTSIASSLGRAGFNPPTDPRYQTIVMLYWLSIGGLLLHTLPGKQIAWSRATSMLLVLLMPVGLLYQQSNFDLLAEVRRSTSAKNIELRARVGLSVFEGPRRPPKIHIPQYAMHEAFLSQNTRLSANLPFEIDKKHDAPGACQSMRIELRQLSRSAIRLGTVKLEVDGVRFQRYREVRIYSPEDGQGVLYPTPSRALSLSNLLWEDTMWQGYYQGDLDATSFTLVFDAVLGPDFHCQLNIES